MARYLFAKTHQGTHKKFNELFIKTGLLPRLLSEKLNETFELRQSSDYDMNAEIGENEAQASIENAETFKEVVRKYFEAV
ncbi:MAG: HEPN domain-containing protein [Thermoflexibacter sp.]|nr:HEPN domain-containing protein [Thermoflexibacter sp.]